MMEESSNSAGLVEPTPAGQTVVGGNSAGVGDGHPAESSLEPTPAEQTGNFLMPEQSLEQGTGALRPGVDRRRFRL